MLRRKREVQAAEHVLPVISGRIATLDKGIEMTMPNASTVGNADLSKFLFAEVGTQPNGLPLTILSVLARLGQDPWVEAARWTRLPKATIVDALAGSIAQMPLAPQARAEARQTAARLVQLLPSQLQPPRKANEVVEKKRIAKPRLVLLLIAVIAIVLGIATAVLPQTIHAKGIVPLSQFDAAAVHKK